MSAAHCSYSPLLLTNKNGAKENVTVHPITGAKIEGAIVPNWTTIKETALRLHRLLAFTGIPLVAWDFALTDEGVKVIEANTTCGLGLIQREQGQRNQLMGNLFRKYDIIK